MRAKHKNNKGIRADALSIGDNDMLDVRDRTQGAVKAKDSGLV